MIRRNIAFFDFDQDGWLIFLVNGHIYPEVDQLTGMATYRQRKILYRNTPDGKFVDISEQAGEPNSSRGCAFGDFDNDSEIDIEINAINFFLNCCVAIRIQKIIGSP